MLALALLASLTAAGAKGATGAAAETPRFSWPQTVWEAHYGGTADGDYAVRAIALDRRDSVIVAGHTSQEVGYGVHQVPLVLKFNSEGGRAWSRTSLGRFRSPRGEAQFVAAHESGEVSVVGYVGESETDPLMFRVLSRFDAKGKLLWSRTLTLPGTYRFRPAAVAAAPGGDIVVAGETTRIDPPEGTDWCVVRLGPKAVVRWTRIGDNQKTGATAAAAVAVDAAGNAVAIGRGRIGFSQERWLAEGYGPKGQKGLYIWPDPDAACTRQLAHRIGPCGRGFLIAGEQVCTIREAVASAVFVKKLDRAGGILWTANLPTEGKVAFVGALPNGGAVVAGEERGAGDEEGAAWPVAMRLNAAGDLVMACRGLMKDESYARYAAGAVDQEGFLVVAGESTALVKGEPVRRIFVRKMKF